MERSPGLDDFSSKFWLTTKETKSNFQEFFRKEDELGVSVYSGDLSPQKAEVRGLWVQR